MNTTTATFRVYPSHAGNLHMSLDTSEDIAEMAVWEGDDGDPVVVELDRDTARQLATAVIAYNGSHSTWTVEPIPYGDIELTVEDGQIWLKVMDLVTPFDLGEGEYDPFVHDFAQRLIVWAGVELPVAANG